MRYTYLLAALGLLSPLSVSAENSGTPSTSLDVFRLPSVYVGVSVNSGAIEFSSAKIGEDVKFSGDNNISLQLGLMQSPVYFNDTTRWGYHTELYFTQLENKLNAEDMTIYKNGDTSGFTIVAEPVLFYQWGSRNRCSSCKGIRIETGVGGRYVDLDGDIRSSTEKINFSHAGFGFSSHVSLVGHYGSWELALRLNSALNVKDNGNKLRKGMSQVTFGYRF